MTKVSTLTVALAEFDSANVPQKSSVQNNQRTADRYKTKGIATLTHGDKILHGHIYDLSMNGLSVMVEHMPHAKISSTMNWFCHVDSKDLPCAIEFIAKVVRQRKWGNGAELGCHIVLIDHKPLRALSAFRTLSKLRKRN